MGNILFKRLREQFLSQRAVLKAEHLSLSFSVQLKANLKTVMSPGNLITGFDFPDERNSKGIRVYVYLSDPNTTNFEPDDDTQEEFLKLCNQAGELIPQGEATKLDEWIPEFVAEHAGRSESRWLTWLFDCSELIPEGEKWSHCAFTLDDVFKVSADRLWQFKGRTKPAQEKRSSHTGPKGLSDATAEVIKAADDDKNVKSVELEQLVGQLNSVARAVMLALSRNRINNESAKITGQAIANLPKAGLQYNTPMKEALVLLQKIPYEFVECPGRGYFLTQRGCTAGKLLDSQATANQKSGQSRR